MEWKWTKGEPYERSRRLKHVQELENKQFSKDMESSAYSSSLHHDENTWDILNQSIANSSLFVLDFQVIHIVAFGTELHSFFCIIYCFYIFNTIQFYLNSSYLNSSPQSYVLWKKPNVNGLVRVAY